MRVHFIMWGGRRGFSGQACANIAGHHIKRGDSVAYHSIRDVSAHTHLKDADLVYMWNGEYERTRKIRSTLRERGVPVHNIEVAWFPQGKYIYVDAKGTNGNCSLFDDPLDWVDMKDYEKLYQVQREYFAGYEMRDEGYIFVPLQLSGDTQIQHWSPLKWMGQVVRHARKLYPDKELVFRPHPKDPKKYDDLKLGTKGIKGDLKDLICGASMLWGVNSIVLLEGALANKPVITIGKSLLEIHPKRDKALAALVARQIPIGEMNIEPWMRPGRGLEHLA